MTSRWNIALASAAGAAVAAVAVVALAGGGTDDAAAVPPDTVPTTSASDAATDAPRTVTVSGHGTVQVVPDVADLSAGCRPRPTRRPRRWTRSARSRRPSWTR